MTVPSTFLLMLGLGTEGVGMCVYLLLAWKIMTLLCWTDRCLEDDYNQFSIWKMGRRKGCTIFLHPFVTYISL